jgi:hypothetical protein
VTKASHGLQPSSKPFRSSRQSRPPDANQHQQGVARLARGDPSCPRLAIVATQGSATNLSRRGNQPSPTEGGAVAQQPGANRYPGLPPGSLRHDKGAPNHRPRGRHDRPSRRTRAPRNPPTPGPAVAHARRRAGVR